MGNSKFGIMLKGPQYEGFLQRVFIITQQDFDPVWTHILNCVSYRLYAPEPNELMLEKTLVKKQHTICQV